MPIYEYKCDECGNRYEQIRRMADADQELQCPRCDSDHVKRLLSSFATTSGGSAMSGKPCSQPACNAAGRFT